MAKTKKPTHQPSLPFPPAADALHQEGNWLWIPLRKEWRDVTTKPEEIVRQKFIRTLVEHYGYALEQMDQERRTQHGHKSPRADIVIWQTATEKEAGRTPVLVIECKTDTIEIQERDYYQGESYNGSEKYGLGQDDFYQLHAYGQSYLDGQGDVVLIYPKADAFSLPLPVFEFPKSAGLRLWVLPFCLRDKRLLLPQCGSLDALFMTTSRSDSVVRNSRISASADRTQMATGSS